MTANTFFRTATAFGITLAAATTMTMLGSAATPKFFDDDPVWVERDSADASTMQEYEPSLMVDLTRNLFTQPGDQRSVRAMNVNTVDEVPDSNWFTNRLGAREITEAEIANGPNTGSGPAAGAWRVSASKSDGVTPGFTVKDRTGQRWFLKFDPPGYRGMATGTEVAVTKLMWALGYNVPENHIAYLRRDDLVVGDGATFTTAAGRKRPMKQTDIDALLERAQREPNGSYRVVASKALAGKPVGRIQFYDTRPDDPNDLVPHEHRRELRAYGVFAAWLNHVDAKSINSLDMLVKEGDRFVVRHHLIDFGSSLGSAGIAPGDARRGNEYMVQPAETLQRIASFGFYIPKWHTERYYSSRSIGQFPASHAHFNPRTWRPRVPNQAFLRAQPDDQFWAAQRLAAMSEPLIRAAVRTGEFGDPASEEFLVRALAERRDAILREFLTAVNPVEAPALSADGRLVFRNAAVEADLAKAPMGYRAVWSTFDNTTRTSDFLGDVESRGTEMPAPAGLPRRDGAFVKVSVSPVGENGASSAPADLYFRSRAGAWQLVGVERMPAR